MLSKHFLAVGFDNAMQLAEKVIQVTSVLFVFITLLASSLWAQEQKGLQEFFTLWAGMLPIILAAPHGGRQPIPGISARRGIGVAQFTTGRDNNTDELAEKVASKIEEKFGAKPFLVVAQFERKYVDANRPRAGAYESAAASAYYDTYHHALEKACDQTRRDWGRGLLLDIHGQAAEGETIFRGTDNGKSVTDLQQRFGREALTGERSILGQLKLRGYKIAPSLGENNEERRYSGGYTTRTYGSHRGTSIDAIQLEFGTSLRSRTNLERTATDLAEGILVFAQAYLPVKRPAGSVSKGAQP
jgi:N-formylglutamate amidohydrolase